jgi:predicted esterase
LNRFWLPLFALLASVRSDAQSGWPIVIEKYLHAASSVVSENEMEELIAQNPPFDSVYARLQTGRAYDNKVKRGFLCWDRKTDAGIQLFALIFIPYDYTPEKKYPVRVFLHGDISLTDPYNVFRFIDTTLQDYKAVKQIRIYPSGYFAARWYYDLQYRNVMQLIDSVKEIYNVDENRISLGGVSDGGTGTYAFANYNVTPYSCFTPYIGSAAGLFLLGQHQAYFLNYANKPFFIVNGARDEVFPKEIVTPWVDQIRRLNRDVSFFMLDTFGHTLRWMPLLKDTLDSFIAHHPRNAFPDHLVWQTEDLRYNRNHWVIIESIGETRHYSRDLQDENLVLINGTTQFAFKRDSAWALIDVNREGNTIRVKTNGVKSFTLLFSPEHVDFSKPVTVYTNELLSFQGILEKNIGTLLKWHAIDHDRTMLFASELTIKTDKAFKARK